MVLLAGFYVKKNRQASLFFFSASKYRFQACDLLERNGFRLVKERIQSAITASRVTIS
jgi:hypothetical protein